MKYGVAIFPTDYAIRVEELAKATEQHGLISVYQTIVITFRIDRGATPTV
jgi:hypothetical protein